MTRPRSNQFGTYFKALHGYEPFPWQRRLAAAILEEGAWPDLLDIPTGLGKTSTIDIALFVLASRPEIAPRRILLVVDRRVVVDQAAAHAREIQRRLSAATEGILATVANALRELWGGKSDDPPFEVAVLRGGMPRDEAWAQRPDRPAVALSTVDQVGSRLLFCGYGVSTGMAPVHAGLLGNDALILLDEVQLSNAFAETLRAIGQRWRAWRESDPATNAVAIPDRWAFVRMSATPLDEARKDEVRLSLDDDDRAHSVVQARLGASKLAALAEPIATSKADPSKTLRAIAEAFATHTVRHLDSGARRIGVIVNRVASARHIHQDLMARVGKGADVVLLTGRMRPLDRDEVLGLPSDPTSLAGRVTAGTARDSASQPVVVVATQTIEAGADFDFDAIVTECASLDALRQRFGRLDRRGELQQSRATILVRKDQATDSKDDPVYGAALSNTWGWLESKAGTARKIDFGINNLPTLPRKREERSALCSPVEHAPVLLPAHLNAWAQTKPRGEPNPEVALWLHGPRRDTPEVRVVWRADIDEAKLADSENPAPVEEYATSSLAIAPPSSLESISIPLPAFEAWLSSSAGVDLVDVEGAEASQSDADERSERPRPIRPFLLVSKAGAKLQRDTQQLYPEATIVVPASYGGIRHGNWNPDATEPVVDLGDIAQLLHRGRPVLRLVPDVIASLLEGPDRSLAPSEHQTTSTQDQSLGNALTQSIPRAPTVEDPQFDARAAVGDWLDRARTVDSKKLALIADALLEQPRHPRVLPLGEEFFVATNRRLSLERIRAYRGEVDPTSDIVNDDDDGASYIGREVSLEEHLGDVERWARVFATNVGLPTTITEAIATAARLHDLGKADPRFQQMLHGGSAVRAAAANQILAKSRGDARDRAAQDQARAQSKYPDNYRHELLSVAMLEGNAGALAGLSDPDLVLHLVGSHHGWCRPFAPASCSGPSINVSFNLEGTSFSADAAHGLAVFGSTVAERYWMLTERYGWWTLAWFEALLRLADHRASEESSRSDPRANATHRQEL